MENKLSPTTVDEQLELSVRLIERYDQLLGSLESRAATVVSADALLLAGITFLLDQVWSQGDQPFSVRQLILATSIGLALIALVLSIVNAASSIAKVGGTMRKVTDNHSSSPNLFFRPRTTVDEFKEFSDFENHFRSSDKEQMLTYALGELWSLTNLNTRRYRTFQWAVRLLLFSIVPFLLACSILIID